MELPSDTNRSGRNLGAEELVLLQNVIASGTLNCIKGTAVKEFEKRFAAKYGVEFCRTTASGTASIHTALAAINPEPGDEIITSPITDMGAITPIIYQTAIPIFADVDPMTYNITAETIATRITRRTRAIIVTHLFGNSCDMDPIMALARRHDLPVIEDTAQAYLAEYHGRLLGTIGDFGCFSLQQGKHITTGEGGIVLSTHRKFARRMSLFVDKGWGYGDLKPDHYFLALNYRMTELQGAVALAQLEKLDQVVAKRIYTARMLTESIADIPGIHPPQETPGGKHVYWKYAVRLDGNVSDSRVDRFAASLRDKGVSCAPRYIAKPAFMCRVLRERNTFGNSRFPFEGEHRKNEPEIYYDPAEYPGALQALARVVVLPWNEFYTAEHVDYLSRCIRAAVTQLQM